MSFLEKLEEQVKRAIVAKEVIEVNIRISREWGIYIQTVAEEIDKILRSNWFIRNLIKRYKLEDEYKMLDVLDLPHLGLYYVVIRVRADLLSMLKPLPYIESITENVQVLLTPEPPQPTEVKVTMEETSIFIGADKAREVGLTGKNMVVGVLDTGSNPKHPLLKGKYKAEIQCAYYQWQPEENTPKALHYHGPGMQSILVTVAPDIQIVSCKIFPKSGSTTLNTVYRGIERAVEQKVDVMSNSWGSTRCSQELHNVIRTALEKLPNMIFSVSMGNSGWNTEYPRPPYKDPKPPKLPWLTKYGKPIYPSINCPADMTPAVLPSGAVGIKHPKITETTPVAAFSSRGLPSHFIVSPGGWQLLRLWDVGYGRYPRYIVRDDSEKIMVADLGKGYKGCRGTSPAAPHTSGVVAIGKENFPGLSRDALMNVILETSIPLGANRPSNDWGFGVANIPGMLGL